MSSNMKVLVFDRLAKFLGQLLFAVVQRHVERRKACVCYRQVIGGYIPVD